MTQPTPWGAVLPTQVWLGYDANSDQPVGSGAGGVERRDQDLEALAAIGLRSLRVGVDWSRLMPTAGRAHGGWVEWYRSLATAASMHDISVWWCLHERGVPRWFADEGGFADRRFTARWWPRWVEAAADSLGDLGAGWVPMDDPAGVARRASGDDPVRLAESLHAVASAWRDAWRILRGPLPVATCLRVGVVRPVDHTVPAQQAAREQDHFMWRLWLRAWQYGVVDLPGRAGDHLADLAGSLDVLGVWVQAGESRGSAAVEDLVLRVLERTSEEGPHKPIHLTVRPGVADPDGAGDVVTAARSAVIAARDEGVAVQHCWLAPGIAGPGAPDGLLDRDRCALPVAEVLFQDRPR